MTRTAIRTALALAAGALLATGVSWAGGATLTFEEPAYQVGDVAYGVSAVGYAHNADLGAPDEGPYYVYLAPATAAVRDRPHPSVPSSAVRVGTLQFRKGPVQEPGTDHLTGPDHAVVEFTVPTLPPGDYVTIVCNDPCEAALGDLIDGRFVIAAGSRSPNALPVTLAAGRGEGSSRRIVVVASGAVLVAACAALVARRRSGARDGDMPEPE